ncbi:hypothetical protein CROQUDRAFT_88171 [Cronartium quercuum f. sp. fusiforme G11]|uniref:Uncharacterized protein n=1 Tax=Cronartium quercuum f. sp. fusiforme G11 TaxID=708437 RepID=A0A9P6TH25_9BASI|nr:hypothetical protein CROQUDRAFT_88171 [Cronartium quercuum f. sp. fusiforme G11]
MTSKSSRMRRLAISTFGCRANFTLIFDLRRFFLKNDPHYPVREGTLGQILEQLPLLEMLSCTGIKRYTEEFLDVEAEETLLGFCSLEAGAQSLEDPLLQELYDEGCAQALEERATEHDWMTKNPLRLPALTTLKLRNDSRTDFLPTFSRTYILWSTSTFPRTFGSHSRTLSVLLLGRVPHDNSGKES